VLAAVSERVSISGLVANALAGPFVGPATVLGFAAAGASLVSGALAAGFGFGAAWSAQLIIWIARGGAQLPGSEWRLFGLKHGLADFCMVAARRRRAGSAIDSDQSL
jgi:competence protein ComEC